MECLCHICNWVKGRPLAEILTDHRWNVGLRDRLLIILRTAQSIQKLHNGKVVHRDIAPDHLYVRSGERTCIINFGMAELINENSPSDPQ
jgi:tRNA A-37 threonylcarbamoyl transferase component Bud32